MTIMKSLRLGVRTLGAVLSMYLSICGAQSAMGVDFHADTFLTVAYCGLPLVSIFVFLYVKPHRLRIGLQALIAIGFFTAYSLLNWRTCTALGYCGTVTATMLETLSTRAVLAAFGVAILGVGDRLLEGDRSRLPNP